MLILSKSLQWLKAELQKRKDKASKLKYKLSLVEEMNIIKDKKIAFLTI